MKNILTIKKPDNFSFKRCLNFLDRGYDECLYKVTKDYVNRLIRVSSGLILIQVSSNIQSITISVNRNVTDIDAKEIKQYVEDWFDLQRDISEFYQLINSCPETHEFSRKYYGLRLMGIVDLFEALCWCVMGQQINLTFAHKMKSRLVHKYGDKMEYEGEVYFCFPTAESLIKAKRDDLISMQFSKQKITYIGNISQAYCSNKIDKIKLLKLSKQKQMEKLLEIKGVGPWTANYVSMKSLRNMSCIAYGDTGLSSSLHAIYKTDKKPSHETINEIFSPFAGWESYLNFYLWKSLS